MQTIISRVTWGNSMVGVIFGYLRKNIFRLVFNLLRLNFVENRFYGENVLAMLFINVVKK